MAYIVTKRGPDDWDDLIGKVISFEWSDGWEEYRPILTFGGTQVYAEDPRYPRYYILDKDYGGYSVWANEEVEVTVHDGRGVR